ncbi:hypothetical protein EDB19DRAFT_1744526, partial [Suillus lakei]
MFFDSPPSALRRVLSPVSWFKCTGDCKKMKPEEQQEALVVSLSACRDNEYAYDDNETHDTVTKFFIECVSQDPKPSLFTLLTYIKDRVDQLNEKRQPQPKVVERRPTDVVDRMTQEKKKPIPPKQYGGNRPRLGRRYELSESSPHIRSEKQLAEPRVRQSLPIRPGSGCRYHFL